jgi:hypothetical protein
MLAALNVLNALGGQKQDMPPAMAQSMAALASAFTTDIAAQANEHQGVNQIGTDQQTLDISQPTIAALLGDIASDPGAVNMFNSAIAFQATAVSQNSDPANLSPMKGQVQNLAALEAAFQIEQQNKKVDIAAHKDLVNTNRQAWAGFVLGFLSSTPLPESVPGEITMQQYTGASTAGLGLLWPTNNAANAQSEAQVSLSSAYGSLDVPLVQGLISKGVIPKESLSAYPWFKNGVIDITSPEEQASFNDWINRQVQNGPKPDPTGKGDTWQFILRQASDDGLQKGLGWNVPG